MKDNVIITASDKKYGDFLIEHWFRSLIENSDLSSIDIFVIDYGLSVAQQCYLKHHDIKIYKGEKDGHVVIIRFREMKSILAQYNYDQVILCDSGDIIFQQDISPVFLNHKDNFRAVEEDIKSPFSMFIKDEFFSGEIKKKLTNSLLKNRMINAGFLVGPGNKMMLLCEKMLETLKTYKKFGPDQILVNYFLHKERFIPLEKGYNFVISTTKDEFYIKNGIFYFGNGEVIPVIHNAGNINLFRVIEKFGYGKECNILQKEKYRALKALNKSSDNFYRTQEEFHKTRKKVSLLLKKSIRKLKKKYKKNKELITEELEKIIDQ